MNLFEQFMLKFRFRAWAPWRTSSFHSFYSSHAQFGEDMVIRYLTGDARTGFYVDLGAHHPVFFSNTYHFYRKGWRGLCVDADARAVARFHLLRPRDISVAACLGTEEGRPGCFYVFDQPALNTLDEAAAREIIQSCRGRLLEQRPVVTHTLSGLLKTYLPKGVRVDFLSIDIEGVDEAVILHQDWSEFHPRIIVFESQEADWRKVAELPGVGHLASFGYTVEAKCGHSIIMTG